MENATEKQITFIETLLEQKRKTVSSSNQGFANEDRLANIRNSAIKGVMPETKSDASDVIGFLKGETSVLTNAAARKFAGERYYAIAVISQMCRFTTMIVEQLDEIGLDNIERFVATLPVDENGNVKPMNFNEAGRAVREWLAYESKSTELITYVNTDERYGDAYSVTVEDYQELNPDGKFDVDGCGIYEDGVQIAGCK